MRFATFAFAASMLAATGIADAQSTSGTGSVVVIPVVAATASYSTEVVVRNPIPGPIILNVKFYEANNSDAPGLRSCNVLSVNASATKSFTLGAQCALGAGSHFGMLVLEDSSANKIHVFQAYSRAQTPGGNGFSVEGFPAGTFSSARADVVGLKRQAASPVYQTNCFIGALGDPIAYTVTLFDANNTLIGHPITGNLNAYESFRMLDVFLQAGAPAGDYANVRATFSVSSNAAMVPFCTVQESTFFGADFRIAKSIDAQSDAERRMACIGQDNCGPGQPVSTIQPEQITDVTKKNVYSMIVTPPDYIWCELEGARVADLQIRLRQPGDPFSSPVFPSVSPYTSGGTGQTHFYIYTGGRNAVAGGTATRWFIDVSYRTGGNATVPIPFGLFCQSGNGTEVPWLRGVVANDFS